MTYRFPLGFTLGFDKEQFFNIRPGAVTVYSAIVDPEYMVTIRENDGPGEMPLEMIYYTHGSRRDFWLGNADVDAWVKDLSDVLTIKAIALDALTRKKYLT